ncbi:MAG: hypothetical protein ABW022_14795 [Actinoplanes sp.]
MPHVIITTSNDRTPFDVDQAAIDRCVEQLGDPDAVLVLAEQQGTAYIPVRQVIAMYVPA